MDSGTPRTLKLDHAAWVLTVDQQRRVLRDASVLIEDGRISLVGKAADLEGARAERTIDCRGGLILPAFVNGHLHLSYAHAVRGLFLDDLVGRERLREVFRLQSSMTEEEEYWTTLLALIELVKSGTLTVVDPGSTRHVDACLQAYHDAGVRLVTGISLIDRPSDLALPVLSTEDALTRTTAFLRRHEGQLGGRLRAWAMPFSTDTCSADLLAGMHRLADELGTWVTIHHAGGATIDGLSPTAYLDRIGALGPNVLLAHAAGITDEEVDIIARSGASVVICPSTAVKEGSGLGRRKLPELLERGVAVGLGTDSANSSNYLDGVRMMHAAAVGFKDGRLDAGALLAETVVELATLTGARALGLADEVGSVAVGYAADLVVFETRRAEWRGLFDPVNNLVYSADGRSVRTVIADGRVVVDQGQVLFADESAVAERVQGLGEELLARTGTRVNRGRWWVGA
jgi:5-methylthioadenosine/S-adenosylhomocysteine deaminase